MGQQQQEQIFAYSESKLYYSLSNNMLQRSESRLVSSYFSAEIDARLLFDVD